MMLTERPKQPTKKERITELALEIIMSQTKVVPIENLNIAMCVEKAEIIINKKWVGLINE